MLTPPGAEQEPGPGPRVLIVDDTPSVRAALKDLLQTMGIQVVGEAGDGASGIRHAQALCPDVVVMDWKMPGMDGIQATRHITALGLGIQVVMLTAYAGPTTQALSRNAGAVAMVAKGDHPTALLATIWQAWQARPIEQQPR